MGITIFGIYFEYWELIALLVAVGGIVHAWRQINRGYSGPNRRIGR